VLAEIAAADVRAGVLAEIEFASGTVRAWTGVGILQWNGYDWTGVGHLGGISPIEETSEVRAAGVALSLSGIPSALVASALGDAERGRPVTVWLAFFDDDWAIVADPYQAFSGRVDVPVIDEGGETATITIQAESRLIDLERPRTRRYTDEDQQDAFPGDRGFEFVTSLQEWSGVWGRS
jgi:hypothetical protein